VQYPSYVFAETLRDGTAVEESEIGLHTARFWSPGKHFPTASSSQESATETIGELIRMGAVSRAALDLTQSGTRRA
jgi:hypothetical protein